jgi:hypothetical protein
VSTRTVIEINHDYLGHLEDHPERLADLVRALKSSHQPYIDQVLPSGIRILGQRHHSETLKLTVK